MIEGLVDLKKEIASHVEDAIPVGLGHEMLYGCLTSPEGEEALTLLVPNFVSAIVEERSIARLLMTKIPNDHEIEDLLYVNDGDINGYPNWTAITHWSFWTHDDQTLRVEAERMFDSMIIGMVSTILIREMEACLGCLNAASSLVGDCDGTLEEGMLLINKANEAEAKKMAPRAKSVMWIEGVPKAASFLIPEQEGDIYFVEASPLEYDSYGPGDPPPPHAGEGVRRMWGLSETVTTAFKPTFRVIRMPHAV